MNRHSGDVSGACKTIAASDSRFNRKVMFRVKVSSPRKPWLWDDTEGGTQRPVKVYNAKEISNYLATRL